MTDYRTVERQLSAALGLQRRPVAVAFRPTPPPGVPKFAGKEPSGCSFWRLAMSERTFYTVPADHHNCPIGSYTHNIPLPPERAPELGQTLALMTGLGYLRMEEVPGIRSSAGRRAWRSRPPSPRASSRARAVSETGSTRTWAKTSST